MTLRTQLEREFGRRTLRNPRYSLRAFARFLSLHHTTLVRLMNGSRSPSRAMLESLGKRLQLTPNEIRVAQQHEDVNRILAAARSPAFRADSRWLAMKTGIDLDDVNRALHQVIHDGRLVMASRQAWTVATP